MNTRKKIFPHKEDSLRKYDTLILLVHPLYNLLYDLAGRTDIELKKVLYEKENRLILKLFLGVYGNEIKQYINKDNVCFCLLTPEVDKKRNERFEKLYFKDYNEILSKFITRGREWLGDRFIVSNYYTTNKLFNEETYKMFEKKIKVIGFGEYGEACVPIATKHFIPMELKDHGIKSESIILNDKSFFLFGNIKSKTEQKSNKFSRSNVMKHKERKTSFLHQNKAKKLAIIG
jgi:hypothetical protein